MEDTNFVLQYCSDAPLIDGDFPEPARRSLYWVLSDLVSRYLPLTWRPIRIEMARTAGDTEVIVPEDALDDEVTRVLLLAAEWYRVFTFCERLYWRGLPEWLRSGDEQADVPVGLEASRLYFEQELNQILSENRMAFRFSGGHFIRPGRAQTQRLDRATAKVLTQPRLGQTLQHYQKARRFFQQAPTPDAENCTKEALCALEAAVEELTGKSASADFGKALRSIAGRGPRQMPEVLVETAIKLHAYRGAAKAVAHAAPAGNKVTPLEAELVLNLVASFITYLADLLPDEEGIPF